MDNETLSVKIFKVETEIEKHHLDIGRLICDKNEIKVAVNDGYINIKEIQLPGKRKMDVKSLLNGYHFDKNAKLL